MVVHPASYKCYRSGVPGHMWSRAAADVTHLHRRSNSRHGSGRHHDKIRHSAGQSRGLLGKHSCSRSRSSRAHKGHLVGNAFASRIDNDGTMRSSGFVFDHSQVERCNIPPACFSRYCDATKRRLESAETRACREVDHLWHSQSLRTRRRQLREEPHPARACPSGTGSQAVCACRSSAQGMQHPESVLSPRACCGR